MSAAVPKIMIVLLTTGSALQSATFLQPAGGGCSELKNHGSYFTVEIEAGIEKQKLDVVVDTGSDELVVPSCKCNDAHACSGRCLKQTIPKNAQMVGLSYGSGGVKAAVMSAPVTVGSVHVDMHESILMMYDNDLDLAGKFEGILALGPPHRSGGSKRMVRLPGDDELVASAHNASSEGDGDDGDNYFYTKSFLEEAGITRFSMCFNRASDGVLRLGEAAHSEDETLGSIGGIHWGLGLSGVSAGSASAKVIACAPGSSGAGTENACGAIPDSGTTFMMAPQKELDDLYAGLCQAWPSCAKAAGGMVASQRARLFAEQVDSCEDLESIPSIFFHLTGTNSNKTLEIPGSAYVYHESSECYLGFDALEYSTEKNGPIWILGLPVFMTYQVGYDVGSDPPSMSFGSSQCTSCSGSLFRSVVNVEEQWQLSEPPRKPSFDLMQPL
jgi:hypothetical protein